MQQHPVPQNIMAVEFQLIGSMTIKQFIYVAAGAVIDGILYASPLYAFIKWPLIALFSLIGLGLAFVPINDLPLDRWIVAFFTSVNSPTKRIWRKEPKSLDYLMPTFVTAPKPSSQPVLAPNREKLDNYLRSVKKENSKDSLEDYEKKFLANLNFGTATPANFAVTATAKGLPERQSQMKAPLAPNQLATPAQGAVVAAHHSALGSTFITKVGSTQQRLLNLKTLVAAAPKLPLTAHQPDIPVHLIPIPPVKTGPASLPSNRSPQFIAAAPPAFSKALSLEGAMTPKPAFPSLEKKPELPRPISADGLETKATLLTNSFSNPTPAAIPTFNQQPAPPTPTLVAQAPVISQPAASALPPTPPPQPTPNLQDQEKKEMVQKLEEMRQQMERMQTKYSGTKVPDVPTAPAVSPVVAALEPTRAIIQPLRQPEVTPLTPNQPAALANPSPTVVQNDPLEESAVFAPKVIPAPPAIGRLAPPKPYYPNVISGWVKDQSGQMVTDVILVVKDTKGSPLRALKSNKIGKFSITTPLPDGQYYVEAEKPGYNFNITEVGLNGAILNPIEIKTA